jgi:hypothetical protein
MAGQVKREKDEKYGYKFIMIELPEGGKMGMPEHSTDDIKKGR